MAKKLLFCPNYSMPLKSLAASKDVDSLVYRARCKQWDCPYCAEVNARVWRGRIMSEVELDPGSQWYFWTLTLAGSDHFKSTAHSLLAWRKSWDRLMKRVKRDLGNFRYVRVFETHKDGTLHIHMLCDKTYSDVVRVVEKKGKDNYRSKALEVHLVALSLGWRHDIRPLLTYRYEDNGNARNVSAYVIKYLTKDIQTKVRNALRDAGMAHVRMIQTSQNWAQTPHGKEERDWQIGAVSDYEYDYLKARDGTLIDANIHKAVKSSDFMGKGYYPNFTHDEKYTEEKSTDE